MSKFFTSALSVGILLTLISSRTDQNEDSTQMHYRISEEQNGIHPSV
jgi:hypothetical protein